MFTRSTCLLFCLVVFAVPSAAMPFICVPGQIPLGDYDGRGDAALADYAALHECLSGPSVRPTPHLPLTVEECRAVFDSDNDGDVDLFDAHYFAGLFTGDCAGLGECPPGTHLEHMSGELDVVALDISDVVPPDPAEYQCVPDESCIGVNCHSNGDCLVLSGKAVCVCKEGYAGDSCEQCAVGFQRSAQGVCLLGSDCRERLCSGQGNCIVRNDDLECVCDADASGEHCENGGGLPGIRRAPTWIEIRGTDRSVELGEPRQICATLFGGGLIDRQLTWGLTGAGTLINDGGNCYTYVPPPPGTFADSQVVGIEVCALDFPDQCATRYLTVDPPGAIKSTGQAHIVLKPFDDNIKRFMRYRCIGGAVLGISIFGKPVYLRGYGNLSGAPTNDPGYLAACGDTFDVSHEVTGYTLPNPSEVQPNTPFRIASNTKAVSAAILRKAIKDHFTTTDTDDNVEATRLCDGVMPYELHEVACLGLPPPVVPLSQSGVLPNCNAGNPCPYGGTCDVSNEETGQGTCTGCPAGFSGFDCSEHDTFCSNLIGHADSRWEDVTIGHVLGHRSGLPRSGLGLNILLPNFYALRDLMLEADWQDQEDQLTSETDFPNGDFDTEFPNYPAAKQDIGSSAYFVPLNSTTEGVLVRMGTCLLSTPGITRIYSNAGYTLVGVIAEYLTGTPFAGSAGRPNRHNGSLLESFAESQLGLPTSGQATAEGIYISQQDFALRNLKEPIWRAWSSANGGTYYRLVNNQMRPYCKWLSNECTFSSWLAGMQRFDWDFLDRQSIQGYESGGGYGPGTAGHLAVEAEVYLRFMAKYWVGGSESNTRYGETRCPGGSCIWTLQTSHTGSAIGTFSDVKQLGGTVRTNDNCVQDSDCSTYTACSGTPEAETLEQFCLGGKCRERNQFFTVPINPSTGVLMDNFAQRVCQSCEFPVGVDIFLAFNQSNDKKCVEAGALDPSNPGYYKCDDAYSAVGGFLGDAVCKVSWPANSFELWPPVSHVGGSSMSPQVVSP